MCDPDSGIVSEARVQKIVRGFTHFGNRYVSARLDDGFRENPVSGANFKHAAIPVFSFESRNFVRNRVLNTLPETLVFEMGGTRHIVMALWMAEVLKVFDTNHSS